MALVTCPHCGHEHEINPAALLAAEKKGKKYEIKDMEKWREKCRKAGAKGRKKGKGGA